MPLLRSICVLRRELRLIPALHPPSPQVELLFSEAEARAKTIFVIFTGTFDVAEFDFDYLSYRSCAGVHTPAALPITRARAAETRVCLRCGAAQLKLGLSRAHRRRSGPGRGWRQPHVAKSGHERPSGCQRAYGGCEKWRARARERR